MMIPRRFAALVVLALSLPASTGFANTTPAHPAPTAPAEAQARTSRLSPGRVALGVGMAVGARRLWRSINRQRRVLITRSRAAVAVTTGLTTAGYFTAMHHIDGMIGSGQISGQGVGTSVAIAGTGVLVGSVWRNHYLDRAASKTVFARARARMQRHARGGTNETDATNPTSAGNDTRRAFAWRRRGTSDAAAAASHSSEMAEALAAFDPGPQRYLGEVPEYTREPGKNGQERFSGYSRVFAAEGVERGMTVSVVESDGSRSEQSIVSPAEIHEAWQIHRAQTATRRGHEERLAAAQAAGDQAGAAAAEKALEAMAGKGGEAGKVTLDKRVAPRRHPQGRTTGYTGRELTFFGLGDKLYLESAHFYPGTLKSSQGRRLGSRSGESLWFSLAWTPDSERFRTERED